MGLRQHAAEKPAVCGPAVMILSSSRFWDFVSFDFRPGGFRDTISSFRVIRETVEEFAKIKGCDELEDTYKNKIASHLMYFTGGHPGYFALLNQSAATCLHHFSAPRFLNDIPPSWKQAWGKHTSIKRNGQSRAARPGRPRRSSIQRISNRLSLLAAHHRPLQPELFILLSPA